jgi:hypothetical protein
LPVIIILLFFRIRTWNLVKIAMQSSSHNWESEIRVPVLRVSRTKADCAVSLRCGESGKIPESVGFMTSPLAEITVGPLVIGIAWRR